MKYNREHFLPVSREDMERRGWDQCDFVYITGDAYVDHSSFGPAIISRHLEAHGYRVGIISQPDWKRDDSIAVLGEPRLAFLVSGGNMDSMVNHYTVAKKRRRTDAYTPGGQMGKRPDYAVVVYANLIRRTYKHIPVIIGGIEASLRRLAHYDYWSDKIKRSVLLDSGADLISYGMGEHSIREIADALDSGLAVQDITFVPGTVYRTREGELSAYEPVMLPSFEEIAGDKRKYAESFMIQYTNTDPFTAKPLVESYPGKVLVVQNPPALPLTTQEMDDIYAYPYTGTYHPDYEREGGVPAIQEIRFSLTSCRGCFGGCSFCALTFHQGRIVQTRSHQSIMEEAEKMTKDPEFKGYIHDVGGPTANFRRTSCDKQSEKGVCQNKQCLFPKPCKNLQVDHSDYVRLLRKLKNLPGVKKVFVRSGIRFDYVMADRDDTFLKELCQDHISGQLRVAPEHISDQILRAMGKPPHNVYQQFLDRYGRVNRLTGKKQYVVPYLMSSHPASTLKEAVELAEYVRDLGYMPQQVQDFYPTPGTVSTCMYYTGLDPRTMKPVYVPKKPHEKAMQRALIQYRDPKNYELVKEALLKAGRSDLIGFDRHCLIPPRQIRNKQRRRRK
ncbi:MAG: YgiQ family radical SAM protein [Eubacterium sp.]|nr:YgiQ family radical SAM protein [Eubacterium sp.]